MGKRALAVLLGLALVAVSPATQGYVLFAQVNLQLQVNPRAQTITTTAINVPQITDLVARLQSDPTLNARVPKESIDQAVSLLKRYQTDLTGNQVAPEAGAALQQLAADLGDDKKDPNMTLAVLFDRLSDYARTSDSAGTYVDVLSQGKDDNGNNQQTVAVRSRTLGKTLFIQNGVEIAPKTYRKTIKRPDPANPVKDLVDAIIIETDKGAAKEQKAVYNRRVHLLLDNLKKLYYDQCSLARKINNGTLVISAEGCKTADGNYDVGVRDEKITAEAVRKMREVYDARQKAFPTKLMDYLRKLDDLLKKGQIERLPNDEWKTLEDIQRTALRFYNDNQLETMQKIVILQLSSYFSQVTDTSPKQKKDGTENIDATLKPPEELQQALDEFEKGHLEGYGLLMRALGATKLSHEDQQYITPELLAIAAEAFADVAYAVKAKGRAYDTTLTGEEQDAAIEESQQWLKLAQVQIQSFEMNTLSIQLERLRDGKLRNHMGLDDARMKAEAQRLIDAARSEYLPNLTEATRQTKATLLKQAVSTFYMTYQNAANAYLYDDTLHDRLKLLAAKAGEMKSMYLAMAFDQVKDNPEYKGRSALDKLQGGAYQYFLDHLPADVAKNAADLDKLASAIKALGQLRSVESIRAGLRPMLAEFRRLARALGFDSMPDSAEVKKEAQRLAIRQAKLFSAVGAFSANVRIFDLMNELDLYIRNYASPEMVSSDSTSTLDKIISFKWMDSAIDWLSGGFLGDDYSLRQKSINFGMKNTPWTREAFQKLGANKEIRKQVLDLLAQGKYNEAVTLIEKLDPERARRALAEYEADKTKEDPFDALDFDSFMTKGPQTPAMVKAQGVVGSLFNQLSPYILGYTAFSAAYDAVFMTIATAGLGFFADAALDGAKAVATAGQAIRTLSIVDRVAEMGRMAEMMQQLARMAEFMARGIGTVIEFVGNTLKAWATNVRNVLGIEGVSRDLSAGERAVQIARVAIPNAASFTGRNMLMMGLASAGIQVVEHEWNPETSQYKSGADAFGQGFLGGLAFGAKAGPIMLFSPVQASAFGSGTLGNVIRGVAESNGPISSTIQIGAKLVPSLSRSAVAEMGPLGALQNAAIGASPAVRALVKMAVWGGGMADGALKYWLAAEAPKELAQVGYYYEHKILGAMSGQTKDGATPAVENLAESQNFATTVSQASWLFVPVNTMYSEKDMHTQVREMQGFNNLMRSGRGLEIEGAANGQEITYSKPWYQWSVSEAFQTFMTKVRTGAAEPPIGKLTVSEQWREQAARKRMDGFSNGELLAVASTPRDAYGSVIRLTAGADGVEPVKVAKPAEGETAAQPVGDKDVRITNEALSVARDLLVKRIRKDSALREGILLAGEEYVLKDGNGAAKISGDNLRKLKEIAANEQIERRSPLWNGWSLAPAWREFKDLLSGRPLENRYQKTVRVLKEGITGETAPEIIRSAQDRMQDMIDARKEAGLKADAAALEQMRRTMESDAFTEYVNERLVRDFEAFQKGRLDAAGLDEAVSLFKDVWEEGVFGKLFKKNVTVDEKGTEVDWEIPEQYQFTDAHNHVIKKFRGLQGDMIKTALTELGKGEERVFALLKTSGGKTLLGFVMLSFMDTYARKQGKKGCMFVTTNGDLVAQAMDAYLSFFKGRKPRFEIITYSDLMARQAQSDAMGTPSPFDTHDVVMDEFDQLATQTALSLGSFNGRLSFSKIDPLQEALRKGVNDVMDTLYSQYSKDGAELDQNSFRELLKKNPQLANEFENAVARTMQDVRTALEYVKSPEFRRDVRDINSPLYKKLGISTIEQCRKEFGMSPEQIYLELRREHKHALGSFFFGKLTGNLWQAGVIQRQHGGLKKWVTKVLEGAYQARSMKDLSKVYAKDPDPTRKGVIQYHNDVPLDNLDTSYRSALELRDELPLTLDFDNLAVTDFRDLNEQAKRRGAKLVALSGTMPDQLRSFMEKDMGWSIKGQGSAGQKVDYTVLKTGMSGRDFVVEGIKASADSNMPFAEWAALSPEERAQHPRNLTVLFAESKAEQAAYEKALDEAGITADRRALGVTPDSNFLFQDRLMSEVLDQKNMKALEEGKAEVVILTGQSGLRGLDMPFDAYKGGEIQMYITNPHTLSTANRKQLTGRIDSGRIPAGTKTTIHGVVEHEFLAAQVDTAAYRKLVEGRMGDVAAGADAAIFDRLSTLVSEKRPGAAVDEQVIMDVLRDPAAFKDDLARAAALEDYGSLLTIRGLREILRDQGIASDAQIRDAVKDEATMKKIAASEDVSETLVSELMAELQKQAEQKSLESSGIFRPKPPIFRVPAGIRRLFNFRLPGFLRPGTPAANLQPAAAQ